MERQHYIDWLRIFAILGVLFFHTAMLFVEDWTWHIQNEERSYLWLEFNFWLSRFRMPLLFFISGFGSYLALRKRTTRQYLGERYKRLMIPLFFAIFFIVPPQIYFERIFNGATFSFGEFYLTTFNFVPYPEGNMSWHHMWFVLYLFIYSAVGLPLFLWLRRPSITEELRR
ncbi:MAG TPA: acyltransferase, partial [Cytophagales bacterium]|nr:acyltransferase [Cytophagales bacterium]